MAKMEIEVKRERQSTMQGSADVYVNGSKIMSFLDVISPIHNGELYYGQMIDGWASTISDADFIQGAILWQSVNEPHERLTRPFGKELEKTILDDTRRGAKNKTKRMMADAMLANLPFNKNQTDGEIKKILSEEVDGHKFTLGVRLESLPHPENLAMSSDKCYQFNILVDDEQFIDLSVRWPREFINRDLEFQANNIAEILASDWEHSISSWQNTRKAENRPGARTDSSRPKIVIEVRRVRSSVTQGSANVYVNGTKLVSFGDKISLIHEGEAYYGELTSGWASTTPDADFIKGAILWKHGYDQSEQVSWPFIRELEKIKFVDAKGRPERKTAKMIRTALQDHLPFDEKQADTGVTEILSTVVKGHEIDLSACVKFSPSRDDSDLTVGAYYVFNLLVDGECVTIPGEWSLKKMLDEPEILVNLITGTWETAALRAGEPSVK